MTITRLSDREFEMLPAQDVEDKIGMYYPETDEVIVRDTGNDVLDIFTALHEMQHASGDTLGEHFDSVNKCYYKSKGMSTMLKIGLPIAAGIFAPMLIPGLGAMGGAGLGIGHSLGGAAASGAATSLGASAGGSAIGAGLAKTLVGEGAKSATEHALGGSQGGQEPQSGGFMEPMPTASPMESFKPSSPTPPNVIVPGGNRGNFPGGNSSGFTGQAEGGDEFERVRGFFSGQGQRGLF